MSILYMDSILRRIFVQTTLQQNNNLIQFGIELISVLCLFYYEGFHIQYSCTFVFITSCNKNDVITEEIKQAPIIELDSETGIYTIKVGRELTIAPTYKYANNALYAWTVDGKLLSSESILKYTWNQEQHLYIKLRVDTPEGYAEEELKVEVLELTPPTISIIIL